MPAKPAVQTDPQVADPPLPASGGSYVVKDGVLVPEIPPQADAPAPAHPVKEA